MYLTHFGLRAAAFAPTPDIAFAFPSRAQSEALDALAAAVDRGAGVILVTGEAGVGKTLLCRAFLTRLCRPAVHLPDPCLSPQALLSAIAPVRAAGAVVCIDQAHAMSPDTLRLLCTPASDRGRPLQVVLFGRPELNRTLSHPDLEPLRGRIDLRHELGGLSDTETAAYLAYRLLAAGRQDRSPFGPDVADAIHAYARGVPRLVNIIAHKALLLACAQGESRVTPRQVREAAADTPRMPATRRLLARLQRPRRLAVTSA